MNDAKRFERLAKTAPELEVMAALQNAAATRGADEWGSEQEQAVFWSVAYCDLEMRLDSGEWQQEQADFEARYRKALLSERA